MITARSDQSESRQSVIYLDQHGREWLTVIDTQARTSGKKPRVSPCIPFQPWKWEPILIVPDKYITIPEGSIGKMVIDYDAWVEDARQGDRDRSENIRIAAAQMYGQNAAAVLANPTPELIAYIGRGPIPVKFIKAAQSGNRWINGQSQPNGRPYPADYVPGWATSIIDELRPAQQAPASDGAEFADEDFVDEEVAGEPTLDAIDEALLDLEDEADPDAVGGKVIAPRAAPRRGKQAA